MSVEGDLYSYLAAKAAITAVVGTRVYPMFIPEKLMTGRTDNYPAITYQVISANHIHHMLGSAELAYKRIQIGCWGRTYKAAKDLAELVRKAMDGYSGTWGTSEIQSCLMEGEGDSNDSTLAAGSETDVIYGANQDYMIAYYETLPTL